MAGETVQVPNDPPPAVVLNADPPNPAVIVNDPNPPPVPDLPAAEPAEEDEFAKMFTQFAAETDPGDPNQQQPKPAAAAPTPTPEPTPAPTPAPAPAVAQEPAPQPQAQPQQPQNLDQAFERLAAALEARNQQPSPQQRQQPQAPALFNNDELTHLAGFYQDWPEVARAVELANRATVHQVTSHVFNEFARVIGPKLKLLDTLAHEYQYDTLTKKIPDYDTVTDRVAAWVQTQPAYLQQAYTGVMTNGTSEEVADLVARYKAATGNTGPAPQPTPTPQTPPVTPPLSPAAIKAAARLAPVSGKRTGPTQGEPTSFEDAFAHFAKMG